MDANNDPRGLDLHVSETDWPDTQVVVHARDTCAVTDAGTGRLRVAKTSEAEVDIAFASAKGRVCFFTPGLDSHGSDKASRPIADHAARTRRSVARLFIAAYTEAKHARFVAAVGKAGPGGVQVARRSLPDGSAREGAPRFARAEAARAAAKGPGGR